MSAAITDPPKVKTYGGFYRPKSFGLTVGPLKLGTVGTIGLIFALMILLPVMGFFGLLGGLVYGLIVAVPFVLSAVPDRHGRTRMDNLADRRGARRNRKLNGGTMRSGALTKHGTHLLPGVAAKSELYTYIADDGAEASFVHYPDSNQFATSVYCEPDGAFGMDESSLDTQVTAYGEFLASLAHEPDLVQFAVTVETAPDGGSPLQREVNQHGRPERAADLSKRVMNTIVNTYPGGAAAVESYATFTFNSPKPDKNDDGTKHKVKRDGPEAIGKRLATTLPHLIEEMPETGAGAVTPMTAKEVAKVVRQAYNPGTRKTFDQILAGGVELPPLDWKHCGPTSSDGTWNWYRHSDGVSVVWEMTGLTSERVRADALLPLLQGSKDTVAMRITFLYRPVTPEKAAVIVEQDHKAADGRRMNSKRPSARDKKQVDRADAARESEAEGAALIIFAILVTATVPDVKDIKKATEAINHLAPTARLHLRPMHGMFAPAFAAGIGPLGFDIDKNLSISAAISKGI
jgi:hypothetical protein